MLYNIVWLFGYVTVVEGLLDNVDGGFPSSSLEHRVQTIMEEMLRLQRDVSDLKQSNTVLSKELATLKSKEESVAFFVYLTNDIVDPTGGQTLIFSGVETNIGNAYDQNHGVFVAPKNGTYHFAFLASTNPGTASHGIHLFMKKNGKNEMYIFLDSNMNYWLQRGATSVLHLAKGDRIWMEVGGISEHVTLAGHRQSDDAYHTHFSGFLITAD